jgi:arsenite-transporting ATPase
LATSPSTDTARRPGRATPFWEFFGGTGGVGKTTCAAAAAVQAAASGELVLVLSTDPAHSLGDALAVGLGPEPRSVPRCRGRLHAAEIRASRAIDRWVRPRRRVLVDIAERGTYLRRSEVAALLDSSIPSAGELFTLVELFRLASRAPYDRVIVDTAPSGHTLRLLAGPVALRQLAQLLWDMHAKHRAVVEALSSRRGTASAQDGPEELVAGLETEANAVTACLTDPGRTAFTWVVNAEPISVRGMVDGLRGLAASEIPVAKLLVNRLTPKPRSRCRLCEARRRSERRSIRQLLREAKVRTSQVRFLPSYPTEPTGPSGLQRFPSSGAGSRRHAPWPLGSRVVDPPGQSPAPLGQGRGRSATRQVRKSRAPVVTWPALDVRLALVAGKGGVGKSTVAAATALEIAADARRRTLLLSIDPAHSLRDVLQLDRRPALPANLTVREVDAVGEFAVRRGIYRETIDAVFNAMRGPGGTDAAYDRMVVRDLLDMSPPGIDQVFAVVALADALSPERVEPGSAVPDYIVVDAPASGHFWEWLDLVAHAGRWIRSLLLVLRPYTGAPKLGPIVEDLLLLARRVRLLQRTLIDPTCSALVIVTRAGVLTRVETRRLLQAVARHRVPVRVMIFNAVTPPGCDRCRAQADRERAEIRAWRRSRLILPRTALIAAAAMAPPPMGPSRLRRWRRTWSLA